MSHLFFLGEHQSFQFLLLSLSPMTPIRLIPSPFSPIQGNEDPGDVLTLKPTYPLSTSCAPQREKRDNGSNQPEEAEEEDKLPDQADPGFSTSGSGEDHLALRSCPLILGSGENEDNSPSSLKPVIHKQEDGDGDQCNNGSVKWMSSKMRLMKKMANPDQTVSLKPSSNQQTFKSRQRSPPPCDNDSTKNSPGNKIRVCSDCNTTKTPLWRSGPQGPKSLCNACGIRQRKARRAMAAAAAAAANGSLLSVETSMRSTNEEIKEKRSSSGYSSQYKKRCKLGGPRSRKKIRFDEFTISLSKNSAFHQVFPQDEKEAAILLMALSCGLVRG